MNNPNYKPTNISALFSEYKHAHDWLISLGVSKSGSRFEKYRDYFAALDVAFRANRLSEILNNGNVGTYSAILNDCAELIQIYRGLSTIQCIHYKKKLKKYASGPEFQVDEDMSTTNEPRNTGFELAMLSLFIRAGFTDIKNTDADITITINGLEYYVECKRPQIDKAIGSNIKKALAQLKKRVGARTNTNRRGIFAVSLNKVINPLTNLLPVQHLAQINSIYNFMGAGFESVHAGVWLNFKDRRLVAGIMHINAVIFIEQQMMMTTTDWAMMFSINNKGTSDEQEVGSIAQKLDGAIRPV